MNTYTEQVKADAKKAADAIRERGWCQYVSEGPDGSICMAQAIKVAIGMDAVTMIHGPLYDAAKEVAGVPLGRNLAPWFNDKYGRTKEEVLAVFDAIANAPSA